MSTWNVMEAQPKTWWEEENSDTAAKVLFQVLNQWDKTSSLQAQNIRNMRLYSNREVSALSIASYITGAGVTPDANINAPGQSSRISINVVKSCVDTLVAKIAKNKIKVQFLTSGGTLEQQTRGKKLTKFMFGHLQDTGATELYKLAFRDALIFGTGFVKTIREDGKIRKERIFPDEIMVDPADSYYGCPRTMYQRRFIPKATVISQFPERAADIECLKTADLFRGDAVEPMLIVAEAWRLPSNEQEGRRMLAVDGVSLVDEEWEHDYFPFAIIRYNEPQLGFWGVSLPEEISGIQLEINRVTRHIQECQRLISFPRIFHEVTSKFNPAHFVNGIGTFIPFSGQMPVVNTPQAVGVEVYNWLDNMIRRAYEITGISQLSASSHKPAGLDSGKALMVYNDIESERFVLLGQAFEKFIVDDCMRSAMLFKDGDIVSATTKFDGLKKLRWGDIKMPHDEYVMQTFPVSSLPNTPAAKLQMVTELKNEGYVQPEEAAELLDYPDLDANAAIRLSPMKLVRKAIERALLEGDYIAPEPFLPLPLALKTAQSYFCWAQLNDFPEERLALVQQYIEDCIAIQMAAAPSFTAPVGPSQQILEQQLTAPVASQQPLTPAIMPS